MSQETNIHLDNFDGPLDLLLSLVKDKKMDIFSIDVSDLASAYLKVIEELKDTDLDLASEYLVMATSLLQLKSKMLLETPGQEEEIEEERKNILSKLAEYQQFKRISEELREKEKERLGVFAKDVHDYAPYKPKIDPTQLDGNSDAVKLIQVMRKMFERIHAQKLRSTTIEKFNLSPAERRLELLELFKNDKEPSFEKIFDVPSINHFTVTMLTILDMARKQELLLEQDEQFGEIKIKIGVINE